MKILCCFPNTGAEEVVEILTNKGIKAKYLSFDNNIFINVALTDDEIKKYDEEHVIGYEGHFKKFGRYPTKSVVDPNFKYACIMTVDDEIYEMGNEYLFITFNASVCRHLNEKEIPFTVVYPERDLKAEYIGRLFMPEKDDSLKQARFLSERWDWLITKYENINASQKIALPRGVYIKDILGL